MFGPEDTGLVDQDLRLCQMLIRIPTQHRGHSINLAQSVMVICYELLLGSLEREPARAVRLASLEQVEAMYAQLENALLEIGFLQPKNADHMMFTLRRMLGRAGLEPSDVGVLRGIARQIAASGAHMLFVAMSSPKKELFLSRHRDILGSVPFRMGVGGSFDVVAGKVKVLFSAE